MNDFPHSQKTNGIADFRVFYHPQNIVVSASGFLFGSKVFEKVGNRVSFGLKFAGVKRNAACGLRPDPGGMVNIIWTKARSLNFFRRQVAGELVNNGTDNFEMT